MLLVMSGFWLAEVTSMMCMASALLAIIQNILLFEYAYIFACKLIQFRKGISTVAKYSENLNAVQILQDVEKQREVLYETVGNSSLRPYLQHHYSDLTEEDIKVGYW